MADRRTQQFVPPNQQGFGMIPQRQQFSAMQQHQMYPMMQQGFPTMPQGMMPQPYPAMFMAPAQPNQVPAGFAPGMMPGQRSMPPPPPYTQTLAENYRMKKQQSQGDPEQLLVEQQRQSEALVRQRQFEQQQQKLRSMGGLGGSKMNADSLIESILGKSKTSGSKSETQARVATVTHTDDGFGDFMTGPTLSHDSHMTPVASNPVPLQVTTSHPVGMGGFGTLESHPKSHDTFGTNENHPKSHDTLQSADMPEVPSGEKKDQVLAMMLQCSDFSAPAKATTFVKKRPVKQSTPPPRVAVTFQSSHNAYRWNASDQLTQMFTAPTETVTSSQQPGAPPSGEGSKSRAHFVVPKWCTGAVPVPTIYTQVLEASVGEGKIDIAVVYTILIKSGLPRETLGHIWNLCNRHTPGELQTDELYLILAMVAIAQNNLSIATLDILHRCPQAPVPYLGQPVPPPPTPDSVPPTGQPMPPAGQPTPPTGQPTPPTGQPMPPTGQPTPPTGQPMPPTGQPMPPTGQPMPPTGQPTPPTGQPMPPTGQPMPPTGQPTPTTGQPMPPTGQPVPVPAAVPLVNMASMQVMPPGGDLASQTVATPSVPPMGVTKAPSGVEENDFADFQCAVPVMTESFGDFAACPSENTAKSSPAKTTNATDLIGEEDKYAAFTTSLGMAPQVLGVPEPLDVTTDTPQDAKPSSGFADFDNAFDGRSEAKITDDIFATNSVDPGVHIPTDDTRTEDFTNFMTAGTQNQTVDHKEPATNDRFSALKSLITNPDLFKSEPIVPVVGLEPDAGMDHGDFSLGNVGVKSEFAQGEIAVDNDGWDDFKAATTPAKTEWANMVSSESTRKSGEETQTRIGWGEVPKTEDSTLEETMDHDDQLAKTIMSSVCTKPRTPVKSYFARNVIGGRAPVGLGISPLDTQPPDFPPDDDNENDFDDFGTFHSSGVDIGGAGGAISTLGCVDAFDDFTEFAKQPSADSTSFSGMKTSSSHDFTGWGGQSEAIVDDVQSMKSLDFKAYPGSKTDSSASGDNQSVSSFDNATVDTTRKIEITLGDASSNVDTVDRESVDSMTLKEEGSSAPGLFPKSQADSGNHNDNEMPQKTWDVNEILTQGGLTALTSDRYSELSSRPQESDRHICEWTRCIDQCVKLLQDANNTFNSISSSTVCHEVLSSQRGSEYIEGITEVYKVALRIGAASKSTALINKDIVKGMKEVDLLWGNLSAFLANSPSQLPSASLDLSDTSLQTDNDSAQQAACGVCLLSVDQGSTNGCSGQHKLTYGVRQYHSSCANFWVNCVNSTLPALRIPELL